MSNPVRYADDRAARQAVSDSLRIDSLPDYGDAVQVSRYPVGVSADAISDAKRRIIDAARRAVAEG